jgi:hypothetical protein
MQFYLGALSEGVHLSSLFDIPRSIGENAFLSSSGDHTDLSTKPLHVQKLGALQMTDINLPESLNTMFKRIDVLSAS